MNKDNLMFAIIGLLLGFMVHSVLSQRESAPRGAMQQTQSMPPNHPPVGGDQAGDTGQQMLASVQTAMKQAREKPTDADVLAMLAVANLDGGHFDAAEKWYKAALMKTPNDVPLLDGLCAALLSKGDAKAAEEAINKLAKVDPTNQDLPQFRDKLASLKKPK